MILITSGAYVIPEFQVELGKIPPCLLPIANKKLIELQVSALKDVFSDEEIYLSLPESYELASTELKIIEALNINIIRVPDEFNLCESLLYCLNTNEKNSQHDMLYLLHGDTYIADFSNLNIPDAVSVSHSSDNYNWEVVRQDTEHALVWSGFFSFSSISYLLKALTLKRQSFVDAVKFYDVHRSLKQICISTWHDLGHVNTYFNSRANITTQRAFNDLKIESGVVKKSGRPNIKIQAEAFWFEQLPAPLKKFIPVLLSHGQRDSGYFYELEYLPYIPLNELFVHGKNEIQQWNKIMLKLSEYLNLAICQPVDEQQKRAINQDSLKLTADKTRDRLKQYAESVSFDLDAEFIYKNQKLPSLDRITQECIDKSLSLDSMHGVLHGDLCYSNILYDSRGDRIKLIDPRGLNHESKLTIYGDIKYDFAKLIHSFVGLYDYIISGYYKIEESANGSIQIVFDIDDRTEQIIEKFLNEFCLKHLKTADVMPLVVLLFFSMLPLHADRPDRQKAMLINALRLYKEYVWQKAPVQLQKRGKNGGY